MFSIISWIGTSESELTTLDAVRAALSPCSTAFLRRNMRWPPLSTTGSESTSMGGRLSRKLAVVLSSVTAFCLLATQSSFSSVSGSAASRPSSSSSPMSVAQRSSTWFSRSCARAILASNAFSVSCCCSMRASPSASRYAFVGATALLLETAALLLVILAASTASIARISSSAASISCACMTSHSSISCSYA